jgi:hypothetical protein
MAGWRSLAGAGREIFREKPATSARIARAIEELLGRLCGLSAAYASLPTPARQAAAAVYERTRAETRPVALVPRCAEGGSTASQVRAPRRPHPVPGML